jgi:hypothetical protein
MTDPLHQESESSAEPAPDAETSFLKALIYPVAVFVGAPVAVLIVLRYLLGIG